MSAGYPKEFGRDVPPFLARFLRPSDRLVFLADSRLEVLIERRTPGGRNLQLLYATIGYGPADEEDRREDFFVRADLPELSTTAESLYEAAGLGLCAFRSSVAELEPCPGTELVVSVRSETAAHRLRVGQLDEWLASARPSSRTRLTSPATA